MGLMPPDQTFGGHQGLHTTTRPTATNSTHTKQTEVLVVSNPLAGAKSGTDDVQQLSQLLRDQGLQPRDLHALDKISPTVNESLAANRLRAVVCVGGDGTVAAVVNRTPPETPLAILPRGTENLLAKYVDQPFDPAGVCDMIVAGHTAQLDVGRAGDKLFLLMLSAGFDADVVHRLAANRTGHITHWSYAKPFWASLRSYQYPELRIYWRGDAAHQKPELPAVREIPNSNAESSDCTDHTASKLENQTLARWAFVSNLPCYARGLPIVPNANGTDGLLDVCAYERGSFFASVRLLVHTLLRRHHLLPDCQMLRSYQLRLESDQPVPYQIDGDPGGWLPVDIELIPQRMRLIVPRTFATSPSA